MNRLSATGPNITDITDINDITDITDITDINDSENDLDHDNQAKP